MWTYWALLHHCHIVSPATVCVKTNTSTFRFARERCSPIRSMKLETLQLECRVQYHSVQPRLNVTTVTEVRPVCCTVNVRWREIFRVVVYGDHGCGGVQAHRSAYLSASVSLREHRWRLLWLKCPINPLLRPENWGKNSGGVVPLMFMSSSLLKEYQRLSQNTQLTHKIRQNSAHQHTEASVCGVILCLIPGRLNLTFRWLERH